MEILTQIVKGILMVIAFLSLSTIIFLVLAFIGKLLDKSR